MLPLLPLVAFVALVGLGCLFLPWFPLVAFVALVGHGGLFLWNAFWCIIDRSVFSPDRLTRCGNIRVDAFEAGNEPDIPGNDRRGDRRKLC